MITKTPLSWLAGPHLIARKANAILNDVYSTGENSSLSPKMRTLIHIVVIVIGMGWRNRKITFGVRAIGRCFRNTTLTVRNTRVMLAQFVLLLDMDILRVRDNTATQNYWDTETSSNLSEDRTYTYTYEPRWCCSSKKITLRKKIKLRLKKYHHP